MIGSMKDLFGDEGPGWATDVGNGYPSRPGYKENGTSRLAAQRISNVKSDLQTKIILMLEGKRMTGSELAATLGVDLLTVRPRLSELRIEGRARPARYRSTGKKATRPNAKGSPEIIWEPGRDPEMNQERS